MMGTEAVVADLMSIDPVVVRPDTTIEEAERLLQEFDITGMPVVDDEGRPVGVISQTDLLTTMRPAIGVLIRAKASGLRVGELMSTPAITVPIAAPLVEAARQMLDARVHRLVVIDDRGRAVGVLSATDFVTLYADG
jgi:CBS-domain-containing membrane protein